MLEEPTTVVIQGYLDALAGGPIWRADPAGATRPLRMPFATAVRESPVPQKTRRMVLLSGNAIHLRICRYFLGSKGVGRVGSQFVRQKLKAPKHRRPTPFSRFSFHSTMIFPFIFES
jgi:hypothetical protein